MRFRKKYAQPMPPWLKWGVLAFLVLAMLGQKLHGPQVGGAPDFKVLNTETYAARVLPGYGQIHIKDIKDGEGAGAVCGQEAEIALHTLTLQNKEEEQAPETKKIILGHAELPQALQEGLLGMKPGGVREVGIPAERTDKPSMSGRYRVELHSLSPALAPVPADGLPLRFYDTRVSPLGTVRCGDNVQARLTIWDAQGNAIFKNQEPVTLALADGTLPVGLVQGVLGMQRGGARTLIIPPALQRPLHEADKPVISVPDSANLIIVEIEILP